MLRVYVLEKEKTIFLFFLVIDQKLLMKVFFGKNGQILGKFTQGA